MFAELRSSRLLGWSFETLLDRLPQWLVVIPQWLVVIPQREKIQSFTINYRKLWLLSAHGY